MFLIKPIKGIYIHVPFCLSKCNYCSFYSVTNSDFNVKFKYITRLRQEIARDRHYLGEVQTLYVGGGTPNTLPVDYLSAVLSKLEERIERPITELSERTIEINPSFKNYYLGAYRDLGFDRISIGVQSFNNTLLKRLRRRHNRRKALDTIEDAVRAGFDNISIDLMFGLPGQNLEDIDEALDYLSRYEQIKHVSAYSLSLDEGTYFYRLYQRGQLKLPDEDLERQMQYRLNAGLKELGFNHYEISNYAKDGYHSKHNALYWNLDGYLGFGPSAASFTGDRRFANKSDVFSYINRGRSLSEARRLDETELKGDFMFLGLRRSEGVSDSEYKKRFGTSFFDDYGAQISSLISRGLIFRDGEKIALTPLGFDLANQVFVEFV